MLKYTCVLFGNFETSVPAFYQTIEYDLKTQELTGLEISRIEYAESIASGVRSGSGLNSTLTRSEEAKGFVVVDGVFLVPK